jgi:hypothetical protein
VDDSPNALSRLVSTSEGAALHRCLAHLIHCIAGIRWRM